MISNTNNRRQMNTTEFMVTLNPRKGKRIQDSKGHDFDNVVREIQDYYTKDGRKTPEYYKDINDTKKTKVHSKKKATGLLKNPVMLPVLTLVLGFILGSIIFGLITKNMLIEAKNINQELKVQLNDLRADVASKDKTIALLTDDKNTLQASLDVSQQKQTELQGRLDKIAKYEKLLLSGNIEKIKTENMTETQKKFVSKMIPSVLKAYADTGVKPSVSLAQAGIESGWGTSGLAKGGNNLYGMKAGSKWKGNIYSASTKEYGSGGSYTIKSGFRAYGSWDQSVQDYVKTMTGGRYDKALKANNYYDAVVAIKNAGYASDPNYVKHITGTITKYNLQALDAI